MTEDKLKELEDMVLTRDEVCRIIRKNNVTLWRWCKDGLLRYHKAGRIMYFLRDELVEDLHRVGSSDKRSGKV